VAPVELALHECRDIDVVDDEPGQQVTVPEVRAGEVSAREAGTAKCAGAVVVSCHRAIVPNRPEAYTAAALKPVRLIRISARTRSRHVTKPEVSGTGTGRTGARDLEPTQVTRGSRGGRRSASGSAGSVFAGATERNG
jgi:hypothetical protein